MPVPKALRCPACQRKLQPCGACGASNRAMATYCRRCGELLTPADEWRLPRADARQSGYLPAAMRMAPVGGGQAPGRRRSLQAGVEALPVAAYDYLCVPTVEKGLQVLKVSTLETAAGLESPFGAPLLHPPAVQGGWAYAVSPLGVAVYDLTRTLAGGETLKPALVAPPVKCDDHVVTPPLFMGDAMILGTERALLKLDVRTGATHTLAAHRTHLLCEHAGALAYARSDGALAGLDPATGAIRWERQPRRWGQPEVRPDPRAGLLSAGSHLVFADEGGQVWVFYPDTGAGMILGTWPEGVTGLALMPDEGCVIGSYAGLYAVDAAGHRRWALEYEAIECPPVVTKRLVLAGTTGGTLLIVDRTTGALDKRPVGSGAVRGIAISGATVLAVTGEGDVAAYDLPLEEG